MKILLINDLAIPRGGAEQYLFSLATSLRAKGHQVTILGSRYKKESWATFFSRFFSLKYAFKTFFDIRSFKPDVVHVHNCSRYISASPLLIARLLHVPIVMTFHDYHYFCPKTWCIDSNYQELTTHSSFYDCYRHHLPSYNLLFFTFKYLKVKLHRTIIARTISRGVCPSTHLLDKMMTVFPSAKLLHLPNFISLPLLPETSTRTADPLHLLYIGRLSPEKGVSILIKAVKQLAVDYPQVKVTIVGTGQDEAHLKYLTNELALGKYIEFVGYIKPENIQDYLALSDIVVLPSVWLENQPLALLEAMAHQKIVLASNTGGTQEIIHHSKNGFLFANGDSTELAHTLRNIFQLSADERMAIKRHSLQTVSNDQFDPVIHLEKLIAIYQQVIINTQAPHELPEERS